MLKSAPRLQRETDVRLRLLLTVLGSAWMANGALADACVVHSHDERVAVTLCQANRSIPGELFRDGFCRPQLKDQQVEVRFVEQCPEGAFGICRDASVSELPYRQDIHYYGVASDARYLQPACEQISRGVWESAQRP